MPARPILAALAVLSLAGPACKGPDAPHGISRFVGRGIGAFTESSGLRPIQVLQEAGGSVYVFEVTGVVSASAPPTGPTRPLNVDNAPQVVQMGPAAGSFAFQEPRVAPGTPAPQALNQVTRVQSRLLRVRTDRDGVILGYACLPR